MAAGWLKKPGGDRVEIRSAGSDPANQLNPIAVEVKREVDIDIGGETPKRLTTDSVSRADVVVTMGCGDTCPYFPGKRYVDRERTDSADQPIGVVRVIREDFKGRIETLVSELLATA